MDTIVICEGGRVFFAVKARVPQHVVPCMKNTGGYTYYLPTHILTTLLHKDRTYLSTHFRISLPSQYLGAVDKGKHVCLKVCWL